MNQSYNSIRFYFRTVSKFFNLLSLKIPMYRFVHWMLNFEHFQLCGVTWGRFTVVTLARNKSGASNQLDHNDGGTKQSE